MSRAEALELAIEDAICLGRTQKWIDLDVTDLVVRIIVEQLGITEECKCDAYSQSCSYCTANVEATQALLELAHHGE